MTEVIAPPRRRRKPVRSNDHMSARVTYIYRLTDAAGEVLYIGRSVNPLDRLKAHHRTGAEWASRAVGVEAWGPFHWEDAVRLEREAITAERPPGNKDFVITKTRPAPVLP